MTTFEATLRKGLGVAGNTISAQLPYVAAEFPEVANCYPHTLNLELKVPLIVAVPDHRTHPIAWEAGSPATEVFDILRVELEAPIGSAPVPAWLYVAHG